MAKHPKAPTTLTADVIVAGAGMAGASLALALKSGGLEPVLVDPLPFETQTAPAFDGRASAIAFSCFRQWRALGAAGLIEPHAQRIEQILVTDGRAPGAAPGLRLPAFLRFDSGEIADRLEGEPLGYMVENRHIRAGLAKAVEAAKIPVLAPAKVMRLQTGASGARAWLEDGREISAPLIVGADGRGSLVRREAGIGVVGWPYRSVGVVATVKLERPHGGVAHEHFLPSGPFAILPLTEDRASLVWTERAERGRALAEARPEAFHAHLNRRFGDFLGRARLDGPRFVYPLSLELAEAMTAPRVALVNQIGPARRFFMQEAGGAVGDLPRLLRGEAL